MVSLPIELWELILKYFSVKNRAKLRLISIFMNNIFISNSTFSALNTIFKNKKETFDESDILYWASEEGYLDVIKFSLNRYKNSCFFSSSLMVDSIFISLSKGSSLEASKILIEFTEKNYFSMDMYYKDLLEESCEGGNLQLVKWIVEKFNIYITKNSFNIACAKNHLELAKWLIEEKRNKKYPLDKYGFPTKFHRFRNKFLFQVFQTCLRCSNSNILDWFMKEFITYNHKDRIMELLLNCTGCALPKLENLTWIFKNFKITNKEFKEKYKQMFFRACEEGTLDTVKWLVENFNLTIDDIGRFNSFSGSEPFDNREYHYVPPLQGACINGSLDIIIWIIEKFNLEQDFDMYGYFLLEEAFKRRDYIIINWILGKRILSDAEIKGAYTAVYPQDYIRKGTLVSHINKFYDRKVI